MVNRYMDGLGPEDMVTPEIKLIQSVGGDFAKAQGAEPGDFFINLTSEIYPGEKGLDIVVADIIKTRTYWGKSDIDNDPPACASTDAKSMRSIFNDDCSLCDKRVEMPGLIEDKEKRRMACTPGYTILGIIASEDKTPVLVRAHGINATPARELNTALKTNRQIAGDYHKAIIHLNSVKQKTASGEAFVMSFKPKAILKDEVAQEFLELTEQMVGNFMPPEILDTVPGRAALTTGETEEPAKTEKKPTKTEKKEKVELPTTDLDF